jgi:hypothetical protein
MKKFLEKLQSLEARKLGEVWVDSGSIHITDCIDLFDDSFEKNMGCVFTPTRYGDGNYDVIGFFEADSLDRPSYVLVDFEGDFA